MERQTVKVKFGGEITGVDVDTFTRTVLAYAAVARAAISGIDASRGLDVQIGSTQPGCLEVSLNLTADIARGLFDLVSAAAPVLPDVVQTIAEYYRLTKFLGENGAPKTTTIKGDGESTVITAGNNATITINRNTYNIYTGSPSIGKAVAASFKELGNNPEIKYVEFSGGPEGDEGSAFRAESGEFEAIASAPQYAGEDTKTATLENQHLTVLRVLLKRSTKCMWQFAWNGIPISANVADPDFVNNLDSYSFSIGDVMEVDLKVTQRYDRDMKAYINERYEVSKVHGKHGAPQTERLL